MAIYGNVVGWQAYAQDRGNNAPTDASSDDADAALQRASDYIRLRYVLRYSLAADDERVVEATYIAASYELTTPGFWSKTFVPSEIKTLTRLDVMSWTPAAQQGYTGSDMVVPVHPAIESLLAPGEGARNPFMVVVG